MTDSSSIEEISGFQEEVSFEVDCCVCGGKCRINIGSVVCGYRGALGFGDIGGSFEKSRIVKSVCESGIELVRCL